MRTPEATEQTETKKSVVDLSNIPFEGQENPQEAAQAMTYRTDPNFLPPEGKAEEEREFRTIFDFPATTMKEQALGGIRVRRISYSQAQANIENPDKPKVLANIDFALHLSNGRFLPVRGAKLKILDEEKGPFVSMEGYMSGDRFVPIVPLTAEQAAFLARYALKEIEKWNDDPVYEQTDEEI